MTTEPLMSDVADAGLVLQASISTDDLDDTTRAAIAAANIDLAQFRSLLLFAQAGPTFWEQSVQGHLELRNPFDERAVAVVEGWFASMNPQSTRLVLYPGPAHLPLGRLAEQVGWGQSSPLGLTIHPEYGLWIAHRVVLLTDLVINPVEDSSRPIVEHPCATCADTACVSACPVDAVSLSAGYDVEACAWHRLDDSTNCAHQCLARNACPVGAEHRYGPAQMRHHYGSGLRSIREWLVPGSDPTEF